MEISIHKAHLLEGESLDTYRQKLSLSAETHLQAAIGRPTENEMAWMTEAYDDYVVYQMSGDTEELYYRISYTRSLDGTFVFGEPMQVKLVKEWVPTSTILVKGTDDQRKIFGIGTISTVGPDRRLVGDAEGDRIPTHEVEQAVYPYVMKSRRITDTHGKDVGTCCESMVFTVEKQEALQKGLRAMGIDATIDLGCECWVAGGHIEDVEHWAKVKNGDRGMFSLGGSGKRVPLEVKDEA